MRRCRLAEVKLEEPEFMREIHRVRAKLAEVPVEEYLKELSSLRGKYSKRLGHLYLSP